MAAEEYQINNPQSEAPPSPAPATAPAVTLPPYPEMIISAIEALNDPNGSNKSAISKQIESTYGDLAPAHSTLLTHHLNRMKSAGQLVFQKNNYLKPDPNAPPRRGRGRPPKPKSDLAVAGGAVSASPRPRGRPPKSNDPDAPPKAPAAASISGKKRGRPPKAGGDAAPAAAGGGGGAPRGRGRPPKVKAAAAAAPVGA